MRLDFTEVNNTKPAINQRRCLPTVQRYSFGRLTFYIGLLFIHCPRSIVSALSAYSVLSFTHSDCTHQRGLINNRQPNE